jgi:histidine triad (HIT) family protein
MISQQPCIFCKIIAGTIPATVLDQTDDFIVIKDIAPKAPVHLLIIPKKHIQDMNALQTEDAQLMGRMMFAAHTLAQKLDGSKAFRIVINNGADVGQTVFHLHIHLLSGKKMTDL